MSETVSSKSIHTIDVVVTPDAKHDAVALFNFEGIDITKGPRSDVSDRVTILPAIAAAEDGRSTEIIGGYINGEINPTKVQSLDLFRKLVTTIDTQDADEAAKMFVEAADTVRKSGDADFVAPAMLSMNQKGEVAWSASQNNATTGLIRIRRNQAFERLGADGENTHGVIRDLTTKDAIYIVPNELADRLQAAGVLNEASIKAAFLDKDGPDIIRTKFTDALPETAATKAAKVALNRQTSRRRVAENRQVTADQANTLSVSSLDHADTTSNVATTWKMTDNRVWSREELSNTPIGAAGNEPHKPEAAATTVTAPTEVIPMGVMSAVDNALRAEKKAANLSYLEEHVFASEALAASVVAKRSKGKLFRGKKATEAIEQRNELLDKQERWTALFDKAQLTRWREEGLSESEVESRLMAIQESRALRRGELTKQEMTKRPFDAFMNAYANLPKKQKIIYGIAAGAILGLAGAAAGGTLGVAGLVGIGVAKAAKTHAQSKAEVYKNAGSAPQAVDREYTVKTRQGMVTRQYTANQLVDVSAKGERNTRHTSFDRADKISRKAAIMTGLAGAALVGGGIVKFVEHRDLVTGVIGHIRDSIFGHTPDHTAILPGNNVAQPHDTYDFGSSANPPAPSHDVFVPKDLGGATVFKGAELDHFNQWVSGHTVQPGESVWKLSQDYLQANGVKNPSVFQIDAVKDKVLAEFSAKGLVDGNGWLMAGEALDIK